MDSPAAAATKAKRPHKEKRKETPRLVLTERIDAILLLLHEYRALSSEQIAEFLTLRGYSAQHTGRRLTTLDELHFIDQINKRWKYITQGTPHRIWGLGDEGAKRLELRYGIVRRKVRQADKNRQIKPEKVEHHLLVAEVMLSIARSCHRRGDVRLVDRQEILARAPEDTARIEKPFQWQVLASFDDERLKGGKLRLPVVPDKVFGLQFLSHPQKPILWNKLEADTGSETVEPVDLLNTRKPSIFHKCLAYFHTHEQRLHTKRFGFQRFRVLFLTEKSGVQVRTDPKTKQKRSITRVQSMQETAMKACGGTLPGLFLFADRKQLLAHEDVLSMPWQTAHGKTVYLDPTIPVSSST